MNKILVVDDDAELAKLLETHLASEGFDVAVASDGNKVLDLMSTFEPDLIVLDIVLGTEDGRDVLREIRLLSDVPTIFLTGRGLESERIAGLKLGADDYIVKPFSLLEVSARIETVLRRAGANMAQHHIDQPTLNFGGLLINENTHEVHLNGVLVELTSKEFALLAFLARSPRQVFSRTQLLEHVWESSVEWQDDATVTEHIRRLRAKLEAVPDKPRWITTVRGVGYRFEAG
ncbi:MAG: response regulator transcription factor [Acidimicrobiaceae bacterium]|nr:response regulator transcription factor [Acidimicrobiaceae bacterium]